MKLLSKLLLLTLFVGLNMSNTSGQSADVTWNVEAPLSESGYAAGETIEICVVAQNIFLPGANWLHGFSFNFSEQFDMQSIIVTDYPGTCDADAWDWYDSVTSSATGNTYGPGFFVDNGYGGPLDGNPGNNWGVLCSGDGFAQFCIQISLADNCGPDFDFNNSELTVELIITGDGLSGSFTSSNFEPSSSEYSLQAPFHCCDANVGQIPFNIPTTCEIGTGCLIDILNQDEPADMGGTWTGPNGWTSEEYCGPFDALIDPPGIYTYTVSGTDGCLSSNSLLIEVPVHWLGNHIYCEPEPILINDLVGLEELNIPTDGTWYLPRDTTTSPWVEVPNGIVGSGLTFSGRYTYAYHDENGCLRHEETELIIGLAPSYDELDIDVVLCALGEEICLAELIPDTIPLLGQWIAYDTNDVFTNFYSLAETCAPTTDFLPQGKIIYSLGAPPCDPRFIEFNYTLDGGLNAGEDTTLAFCTSSEPVILETLLAGGFPGDVAQGLEWTDHTQDSSLPMFENPFDPSLYPENTVLELSYSSENFSENCYNTAWVTVHILPEELGEDQMAVGQVCLSDAPFLLSEIPDFDLHPGGVWYNPENEITSHTYTPGTSIPGQYTYQVITSCDTVLTQVLIDQSSPGLVSESENICVTDEFFELNEYVPQNFGTEGTWLYPDSSIGDASLTVNGAENGLYIYTVFNDACTDSVILDLRIEGLHNAGPDMIIQACEIGEELDMSSFLSIEADTTGSFLVDSILAHSDFNGAYEYIIHGALCPHDTAQYEITFNPQPLLDDMSIQCVASDPSLYQVLAIVDGGTPPYLSQAATIEGNLITSMFDIAENPNFSIEVQDQNGCALSYAGNAPLTDGDGFCSGQIISGCMIPSAANYNPFATIPGWCAAGGFEEAIDDPSLLEPDELTGLGLVGPSGELNTAWDFIVYPNPSKNGERITLRLKGVEYEAAFTLQCYDMTGRLVIEQILHAQKGFNQFILNPENHLDNGVYIVSLVDNIGIQSQMALIVGSR